MLCDFGVSRMVKDGVMVMGTDTFKFNINWLAIEPYRHNMSGTAKSFKGITAH